MFTSLINPASARRRAAWLKDPPGPHLYAFVLAGVQDPLDPDPLWEHRYSGAPDICDKATGRPERRLREALDAHRQRRPELDQRGRLVEALYVYTDVVASIPRRVWRNAIKAGGARLAMLANNLAVRHAEDFKADLPAGRMPRYVLRPADALADDEVGFAFG
nr:hypothetical protein [Pseudomonadota bacterium]